MAIYHLNAKVISRGRGQSAIAAAAYRSGKRLYDEAAGETKHYRARSERIVFAYIMAPKDAPEWAHDRNKLWNLAERAERRRDAQLAREVEISLPHELTEQQREWLVKDFAREAFVRRGYAVDIAIHAPNAGSDARNHHAHLMVTMRELGPEGFAVNKDRSLNARSQLGEWREQWEQLANRHLERHGHAARIDHHSLEAQGVEREPGAHLGYAANEMTRRGGQSDRWDELQGVLARNDIRIEVMGLDREIAALEASRSKLAPARGVVEIEADDKAAEAEAARTAAVARYTAQRTHDQITDARVEALAALSHARWPIRPSEELVSARAEVESLSTVASVRLKALADAQEAVRQGRLRRTASNGLWAWITGRRSAADIALRVAEADELLALALWRASLAIKRKSEELLASIEEKWLQERARLLERRTAERRAAEQRLAWIQACADTLQSQPALARCGLLVVEEETSRLAAACSASDVASPPLEPSQHPRLKAPRLH